MPSINLTISPVNVESRKNLDFRAGDTVRVFQKVKEGDPSRKGGAEADKTRIQAFDGLVLARKHGKEPGATFTVRKVVSGVGVERVFPLYSPEIDRIEIKGRSKFRRAKLYYIRDRVAREIRKKMKSIKAETKVKPKAEIKEKNSV